VQSAALTRSKGAFFAMTDDPSSEEVLKHIPESYLVAVGKICVVALETLESVVVDICTAKLAVSDI
jgi:hypothetical protein